METKGSSPPPDLPVIMGTLFLLGIQVGKLHTKADRAIALLESKTSSSTVLPLGSIRQRAKDIAQKVVEALTKQMIMSLIAWVSGAAGWTLIIAEFVRRAANLLRGF